jgi:hypothetical protein
VLKEFNGGLFPEVKRMPEVHGSVDQPSVFNLAALREAERNQATFVVKAGAQALSNVSSNASSNAAVLKASPKESDSVSKKTEPLADGSHPVCFLLEDLMSYLNVIEVELNTAWPAWIDEYDHWGTDLGETHTMYMTLSSFMIQKVAVVEKCVKEGAANCADADLASIAFNQTNFRIASQKKLEALAPESKGATAVLSGLSQLHTSALKRSAQITEFRTMLSNVTQSFTTKAQALLTMRKTYCPKLQTKVNNEALCDETVQAWQDKRLSFSSYYMTAMGELHDMDLRLAALSSGEPGECPFKGPMAENLQELAIKCPPLEKTTRGLQNWLMDWEGWKTAGPNLAKNLRSLAGHVKNELAMTATFSGNDTEAYLALNSTSIEVAQLTQGLQGFVRGAADWTYEAARLSNFALSELFELRGQMGCVEFDVRRRMGAPVDCGGMREWYTNERNALEAEMQTKSLDFQKDLRMLKERAWKFQCSASVDLPPEEPGCYAITPSGCPLHPQEAFFSWARDDFGEKQWVQQFGVNITKFECIVTRRIAFQTYCGTVEVTMYYSPPMPVSAGCWVYTPSGCPSDPSFEDARLRYTRDQEGEANNHALSDKQACEVERKLAFDQRCGVEDTRMYWRGSTEPPVSPGCWYHTPLGCPSQPMAQLAIDSWQLDKFGAATVEADLDKNACLVVRKKAWQDFCGTDQVMVHFVPPAASTNASLVAIKAHNGGFLHSKAI